VRLTEPGDTRDQVDITKNADAGLQRHKSTFMEYSEGTAVGGCNGRERGSRAESSRNNLDKGLKNMAIQTEYDCFSYEPQAKVTRLEPHIEASAEKNEVDENITRDMLYTQERRRKVPKRTPIVTIHPDFYQYQPSTSTVPETILARYWLPRPVCNSTALVLWSPPQDDRLCQPVPSVKKEEDESAHHDTRNGENCLSDVQMEEVYYDGENDIKNKIGVSQGNSLWLEEDTDMEL